MRFWKPIVVAIVLALTIAWIVGRAMNSDERPWIGLTSDLPLRPVGNFKTLEACRVEVGKAGGWCGKHCKNYRDGSYADCAPLVQVERVKSGHQPIAAPQSE
jgi:hypothetical protein